MAPLQTQLNPNWATFLLYKSETEGVHVWTKENLIAIRDAEKEFKADPNLARTCYSVIMPQFDEFGLPKDPVPDKDGEFKTVCVPQYFRSVLDVIPTFL